MLIGKKETTNQETITNDVINKVLDFDLALSDESIKLAEQIQKRQAELTDIKAKMTDKINSLKSELHNAGSFSFDIDKITQEPPEMLSIKRLRNALKQPFILDDEYRSLVKKYLISIQDRAGDIDKLGAELTDERERLKKQYDDYCNQVESANNKLYDVGLQILTDSGSQRERIMFYAPSVTRFLKELDDIDSGKVNNSTYKAWR